jgi:hypothetical protein
MNYSVSLLQRMTSGRIHSLRKNTCNKVFPAATDRDRIKGHDTHGERQKNDSATSQAAKFSGSLALAARHFSYMRDDRMARVAEHTSGFPKHGNAWDVHRADLFHTWVVSNDGSECRLSRVPNLKLERQPPDSPAVENL